jgi:hypothetical protein
MLTFNRTSLVYNDPNKIVGLPPYYYRLRRCDTNLNGNTPADQYQKLKLIQKTVRVPASLYTANLGPLTAYKKPTVATYGVCWNQMSDRPIPSVQRVTVPTGTNNSLNSRHHSVTSSRPGCQTPGGYGCDIKHNSYDRYLNRLKGKGPMRRGAVPPYFGQPIPFNPAFPIYGGKTMKTSIIDGCDCPIEANNTAQDELIYNDPLYEPEPIVPYGFNVGTYVYAIQTGNNFYTRAIVISINGNNYTIEFDNGTIETKNVDELKIYFPCNCDTTINGVTYSSGEYITIAIRDQVQCTIPASFL